MKQMKTRNPTPEDIIDSPEGPLLKLKLICNQCGATAKHEFEYAMVNPEFGKCEAEEWDGRQRKKVQEMLWTVNLIPAQSPVWRSDFTVQFT